VSVQPAHKFSIMCFRCLSHIHIQIIYISLVYVVHSPCSGCVCARVCIWISWLVCTLAVRTQGLTKLRKISCMCILYTAVRALVSVCVSGIISHTHTQAHPGRKQQQGHLARGIGVDFSMIFSILRKIFGARRIFGRRWDYVTCLASNSVRKGRP